MAFRRKARLAQEKYEQIIFSLKSGCRKVTSKQTSYTYFLNNQIATYSYCTTVQYTCPCPVISDARLEILSITDYVADLALKKA